jgi:hypothetical protein
VVDILDGWAKANDHRRDRVVVVRKEAIQLCMLYKELISGRMVESTDEWFRGPGDLATMTGRWGWLVGRPYAPGRVMTA